MTAPQDDPFATIAPDEAQAAPEAPQDPWDAAPAPVAPAPQPPPPPPPAPAPQPQYQAPATPPPAYAPVAGPVDHEKVVLTFKGGTGYDAPWIVVRGHSLADAADQLKGENAKILAQLMSDVQRAGRKFAELGGALPAAAPAQPQYQQQAPAQGAPPAGAMTAPNGEARHCAHGAMAYKNGNKNGKFWQGFFCPTPKGTPGQCKPQFVN